jgi:hypothetical protein
MSGDLQYAHEKYSLAVSILATTEGTLRQRLVAAVGTQALRVNPGQHGQGPPMSQELANEITNFHARLTVGPERDDESNLDVTVRSLTPQEVQQAAQELMATDRKIDLELVDAIDR